MCGIWALFGSDSDIIQHCSVAYNKLHHRGPDAWRLENDRRFKNCSMGFHRLAIVDDMFGMQPMRLKTYPHVWLICNGELYNCHRLQKQFDFKYETKCDVEVIIHLYMKGGIEYCASSLDGVFAFCLLDTENKKVFIARDTFGVRPCFRLKSKTGVLGVSSEAKGLIDLDKGFNGHKSEIEPFPPGHYETYFLLEDGKTKFLEIKQFHSIGEMPKYKPLVDYQDLSPSDIYLNIRTLLVASVKKRLMANRRIGCLLSGGLDSSLVSAILVKLAKEENLGYNIQSFSIGMEGSPDILAARKVAAHIGSEHHEVLFTPNDVAQALERIIYHLESFDITTVRASVGMYLISKYIQENTDTTVILSGEGADELAQGYIYFHKAPSGEEGDKESRRLLKDLYMYDVLRADRTTAAHSLELRVPFLDHQFTSYYLSLLDESRQPKDGIEKHLLRAAFADTGLLPDSILWRHKEAFSDGVTSKKKSLFSVIQEIIESKISDDVLKEATTKYKHLVPKTKEALYFRQVFESSYPGRATWIPYIWMPKWTDVEDPSARYLSHYATTDE